MNDISDYEKVIGRVVQTVQGQPLRPQIQMIFDDQGTEIMEERIIDLKEFPLLCIVNSVDETELPAYRIVSSRDRPNETFNLPCSSPLARVIRQIFFLHIPAAALLFVFFAGQALASPTIPSNKKFPPSTVNITYDIDFLWFKNMARGLVRLRMISKNSYRAELLAEAKGLIGLLTSYQKNHYINEMEFLPEQGRLLSRKFTIIVTRREFVRKNIAFIDYKNH